MPEHWNLLWQRPWSQSIRPLIELSRVEGSDDLMWSAMTPSGNVSLLVLAAPSSSFGPCFSLYLIRYDKLPGPPLTKQSQAESHPSLESCWTLAVKGDDMCLLAHLSSLLNCKHIILKTALETQQMSNWYVNYHYAPLMSLSTALWL